MIFEPMGVLCRGRRTSSFGFKESDGYGTHFVKHCEISECPLVRIKCGNVADFWM